MREGDEFESNSSGRFTLVKYNNSRSVLIRFNDTGYEKEVQAVNVRLGRIKDPYAPSVEGVGCVGEGSYSRGKTPKAYETWRSMLKRCYAEAYKERYPTYYGKVHVCDEWHNLQLFGVWFDANYVAGCELDKDDLSGALYSPETCKFLPRNENRQATCRKNGAVIKNTVTEEVVTVYNRTQFSRERGMDRHLLGDLINEKRDIYKGWVRYGTQ